MAANADGDDAQGERDQGERRAARGGVQALLDEQRQDVDQAGGGGEDGEPTSRPEVKPRLRSSDGLISGWVAVRWR